jgi:SAM-dependent methyltransferase
MKHIVIFLMGIFNLLHATNIKEIEAKNQFLLYELANMNEKIRRSDLRNYEEDSKQTLESFDYQWENLSSGKDLPSNPIFIADLQAQISSITGLPQEWSKGKKIIDIGCGLGRFTYGFLLLGAEVTSCDASKAGINPTAILCQSYSNCLNLFQADILKDDLAFCFGVVHHTGNTYLAIKKVCETVKIGGKVFLMVYGYPEKYEDFLELNTYESLRSELRLLSFEEKINFLSSRFPEDQIHGWFDATSPKINDLLKYTELVEILAQFGINNISRTVNNRNLHAIGDRRR